MASVLFFSHGIDFKIANPRKTSSWINRVVRKEKRNLSVLNCVFCSDAYLLRLNVKYMGHNTLTDILTFDYSRSPKQIDGEIYVSIQRVKENASSYESSFDEELHRVIIHGVLHLLGYKDKKTVERAQIRKKEEAYLSLRQ